MIVQNNPTAPVTIFASVMGRRAREKEVNDHCLLVWNVAPPPESVVNLAPD